jgi:L-fucose mutarotase
MLKGIPDLISPELLKILHEMGHADELVIGDSNYPAASTARRLVRADGHRLTAVLDAILELFPLDTYVAKPVAIMQRVPGDTTPSDIHDEVRAIIRARDERGDKAVEEVERFAFYARAKEAYAVVATTEKKAYGCVIIKKGVVR